MRVLIAVIAVIAALFFTTCDLENRDEDLNNSVIENPEYGELQDRENPPFEFVLIDSVVLEIPDGGMINRMMGFRTDTEGNRYILDNGDSKLYSFQPDGSLNWQTGQEGRGPGDFENAYGFVLNEDFIFVGNMWGTRLDKFDKEGNFIQTLQTEERLFFSNYLGMLDDDKLVLAESVAETWGSMIKIFEIKEDSAILNSSFVLDQAGDQEYIPEINSSGGISLFGNTLYSTNISGYTIQEFSLDSSLQKTVTRDVDKILRSGMYEANGNRRFSRHSNLRTPFVLRDGSYVSVAYWATNISDPDEYVRRSALGTAPEPDYKSTIDFFNSDGTLLYSIENDEQLPDIGSFTYKDHNDVFYVFKSDNEDVIYRYELVKHI